jgi:Thioesterase-like superfamily
MGVTFFEAPEIRRRDGDEVEWFTPTDACRGPWDPEACHGGPPTGLIVRAMQRAVPGIRLARITTELMRPIPMAGFRIDVEVVRSGRSVASTRAAVVDGGGEVRATATGMHVREQQPPLFGDTLENSTVVTPRLASSRPGEFPVRSPFTHDLPWFGGEGVRIRYAAGETPDPGATTAWMSAAPLLPEEAPTPFQAICPLADCGNAFSRHGAAGVDYVNTDLTIALHRDPAGEWFGTRAASWWQPGGVGLTDALLFDDGGPVGRALQTLVLRASGA